MTRTSLIWAVVVLVILAALAFFAFGNHALSPSASTAKDTGSLKPAPAAPSGSDTSDHALQQDTAAIDAQMNGFNSDNASVDSNLNDKPVSQ